MNDDGLHQIADDAFTAQVSPMGATLHRVTADGIDLLSAPAGVDPGLGHHGAVLAPWPNRIAGGVYGFDGSHHQLPITDPAYGHALHGFVFDRRWSVTAHSGSQIALTTVIRDEPGYPFAVRLEVTYQVRARVLHCTSTWQNVGDTAAPFGIGFHPYLRLDGPLEAWTVHLAARVAMETSGSTKLPLDPRPTSDGADFLAPAPIGDRAFSRAYGALARDRDGVATVELASRSRRIVLRMSERFRWVQVFTADLPAPELRRAGLAVEPQTCPPNAFVDDIDVIRLEPGERGEAWWMLESHSGAGEPAP